MARYTRIALDVEAIRLTKPFTLTNEPAFGKSTGVAGDWLITEANGTQYILTDAQFQAWFVPNDCEALPAPTVTCDQGASTTVKRPTWRWGIVTNAAGYRYRLDGSVWSTISTNDFREYTPSYDLSLGNHTLEVQALDAWDLPGATGDFTVEITA